MYPAGTTRPLASSINFDASQSAYANHVLTRLGTGGQISIYNGSAAPVHVLMDLTGFVVGEGATAPGTTVPLNPARVLDTATGNGAPRAPLRAGQQLDVQIGGRGGVPTAGVAGVWIQLTVASPRTQGFVVGWAAGRARPLASTVNFAAAQTVANQVFIPLGSTGKISVANQSSGTARLVADVVGYTRSGPVEAEGGLAPLPPQRVLDTQTGVGAPARPVASRQSITVQVAGRAGVPLMGARAVMLNVTAASAQSSGFLTIYAGNYCTPARVSSLNFGPGRAIANMVLAPLAGDGTVTIFNGSAGTVRIVADVSGHAAGPQAPAGAQSIANGAAAADPLSITDDGRSIGYGSYVWDAQTEATTLMAPPLPSRDPPYCDYAETPTEGSGSLSGDGQYALYSHPPSYVTGWRLHVWDRSQRTTQLITEQPITSASITDDGRYVAYTPLEGVIDFWTDPTTVMRWNRLTGATEALITAADDKTIRGSRISGDGTTVIYEITQNPGETGPYDVFRWRNGASERIAEGSIHEVSDDGDILLMTATDGASRGLVLWSDDTQTVLPDALSATLSGNGQVSVWQRLESSDPNAAVDVYRQEVGGDAVKLFSHTDAATALVLSDDGSRLAYTDPDPLTNWWAPATAVLIREVD